MCIPTPTNEENAFKIIWDSGTQPLLVKHHGLGMGDSFDLLPQNIR